MPKKSYFKVIVFTLNVIAASNANDYNYDENPFDPCSSFYDTEEAGECHHNQLPNRSFQDMFGPQAVSCCPERSYRFYDHCEDRNSTFSTFACGSANRDPQAPRVTLACPVHCRTHHIQENEFKIINGQISLKTPVQGVSLGDYCLYHECSDIWKIRAETCICFSEEKIREIELQIPPIVKRCCDGTNFFDVIRSPDHPTHLEEINCLLKPLSGLTSRTCSSTFHVIDVQESVTVNGPIISFVEDKYPPEPPRNISTASQDYCFGVGFNKQFNVQEPLKSFLVFCKPPCDGQKPCLGTCCSPLESFNDGVCQRNENSTTIIYSSLFNYNNIHVHLDKASTTERSCPEGYVRKPYLEPEVRCADAFKVEIIEEDVRLEILSEGIFFNNSDFCVVVNEDSKVIAEVCRKISTFQRFKFYPYILITSIVFLVITLAIYTIWSQLLNLYTRLMRHFTLSMMLAFVFLATNQLTPLGNTSTILCSIMGFVQQYFFMVMFLFMTIMSFEIWNQMRGNHNNESRYRKESLFGYLLPLLITIVTLITELSAPRCAAYRPRFGEQHCFFTETTSKGIWFFLPIGMMLLINASLFISTIVLLRNMDKEMMTIRRSAIQAREKMERFMVYCKLFVGMGLLWFFEIIAGLAGSEIHESSWFVTDLVNMLQGFFVFLVFVCKRNVWNAIRGKRINFDDSNEEHEVQMQSLRTSSTNNRN